MKPAILIMGILAGSLLMAGCDSTESKKETSSATTDTAAVAAGNDYTNFCLSQLEGEKMIGQFQTTFKAGSNQAGITDKILIDSHTLARTNNFITDKKYDGYRIYLGAAPN